MALAIKHHNKWKEKNNILDQDKSTSQIEGKYTQHQVIVCACVFIYFSDTLQPSCGRLHKGQPREVASCSTLLA